MLNEISITKYASIKKPITIPLGKTNLIIGTNNTGKSAICDAIMCLFEYKKAFSKYSARFSDDYVLLQAKNLLQNKTKVSIERNIKLNKSKVVLDKLIINGQETYNFSSLPSILRIIYINEQVLRDISNDRKFAKFCVYNLTGWEKGLTKQHFVSLNAMVKQYNSMPNKMFESIEWLPKGKIRIVDWDSAFVMDSFDALSGSERCLFLTDIAILLAQLFSEYSSTLIMLDGVLNSLDNHNIEKLRRRIDSISNPNLQFVLTTWKKETELLLKPDTTIKLDIDNSSNERFTVISDIVKITPKNILDIEESIKKYDSGDEDKFINTVVLPLLFKMGFLSVKRVQFHGPGELGLDIGPFNGSGFEWREAFCGAQVKSVKLNSKSGNPNNINSLIDEVSKALNNKFYNQTNTQQSHLDYVFVILSQYPTPEALNTFCNKFEGDRRVIILDPIRIAELITKYGVSVY